VGRSGTALFVAVFLSTVVSAEPERPCPACGHGMARVEGQVTGEAFYLCRFCEVAVHVKPDARETVSYRSAGKRYEFELVNGARICFPVPGIEAPEDVIVPVDQAAFAAAHGAGHPVTLPGHPVNLPGHPVPVPTEAPVNLPDHPVRLPGHPVELPAAPVELPGAAVELPGHPVELPAHSITILRHPVKPSGPPVLLPGHPVWLPGHPVAVGGTVVTISRAPAWDGAIPVARPKPSAVVVQAPPEQQQSRFFGRPAMPSVLRGLR